MKSSANMKAVLVIAQHKEIGAILNPLIDLDREEIHWERLSYAVLPGGYQTALSWVYCVFCDGVPPLDWNFRDPFDNFALMDRDIQILCMQALALRHGFLEFHVKDKPESEIMKFLKIMEKN